MKTLRMLACAAALTAVAACDTTTIAPAAPTTGAVPMPTAVTFTSVVQMPAVRP